MGWGGRLFEAGRLLTFSAFRMGAYSRGALIRGWALNRINTAYRKTLNCTNIEAAILEENAYVNDFGSQFPVPRNNAESKIGNGVISLL